MPQKLTVINRHTSQFLNQYFFFFDSTVFHDATNNGNGNKKQLLLSLAKSRLPITFFQLPLFWTWWRYQMENFPRYWPFVRGIHRSPVNFRHKGQWRGAFMFSLICAWTNGWVNNRDAADWRRDGAHFGVTVMEFYAHLGYYGRT